MTKTTKRPALVVVKNPNGKAQFHGPDDCSGKHMPQKRSVWLLLFLCLTAGVAGNLSAQSAVNVTQFHNHLNRDGVYVDPAFTYAAASSLTRDILFNGTISGNVAAQPLYIEGGPLGRAMVIVVTESNNVYALDAAYGTVIWQDNVGKPITSAQYPNNPCATQDFYYTNVGITGTPV